MKTNRWTMLASALALVAGTVCAQPAPGAGSGPGPGPGAGASTPGMGMGGGMGQRAGRGMAARWGADFTPGWTLMTQKERTEHRDQMRAMKTYDECRAYLDQHHEQMAARAKEKGGKPLAAPRRDGCAALKP